MTLRIAIPTNSELLDDTVEFLAACGVRVSRRSSRSLSAPIGGIPDSVALFQRSADIPLKVEEATADLAVVGLDRYLESTPDGTGTTVLNNDLGFGQCRLMLAVPEAWVDVDSVFDLADLSVTAHSVTCSWLGINDTQSYSSIGLLGDWNCGCASLVTSSCLSSGYPYHDDLAIGVGLQSCHDNNSCARGGSGHAAGQTRGLNGTDNSGVFGPWWVFGR